MFIRRLTQTPLQRFQITPHQLVCAMAHAKIETIRNGPYIVTGEVELIDADGNKFPVEKRMALCRCGASTEKPFCDGTHSKVGFKAAEKRCRNRRNNAMRRALLELVALLATANFTALSGQVSP